MAVSIRSAMPHSSHRRLRHRDFAGALRVQRLPAFVVGIAAGAAVGAVIGG